MSEPPRRSARLGGGDKTVENEDPPNESTEALAQRAAEESRSAQLASEQGIPANLYPDPGLPLTGPLTLYDQGGGRAVEGGTNGTPQADSIRK